MLALYLEIFSQRNVHSNQFFASGQFSITALQDKLLKDNRELNQRVNC